MNKIFSDLNDAISDIIEGFLSSAIASIFAGVIYSLYSTGMIPFYSILLFHLLNLFINIQDVIDLIKEMPYWATSYSLGWLVGVSILANLGISTGIDIVISTIILIVFLVLRLWKWWRGR